MATDTPADTPADTSVGTPAPEQGPFVLVVEDQQQVIGTFTTRGEAEAYAVGLSWDTPEDQCEWWNVHALAAPEPLALLRAKLNA